MLTTDDMFSAAIEGITGRDYHDTIGILAGTRDEDKFISNLSNDEWLRNVEAAGFDGIYSMHFMATATKYETPHYIDMIKEIYETWFRVNGYGDWVSNLYYSETKTVDVHFGLIAVYEFSVAGNFNTDMKKLLDFLSFCGGMITRFKKYVYLSRYQTYVNSILSFKRLAIPIGMRLFFEYESEFMEMIYSHAFSFAPMTYTERQKIIDYISYMIDPTAVKESELDKWKIRHSRRAFKYSKMKTAMTDFCLSMETVANATVKMTKIVNAFNNILIV